MPTIVLPCTGDTYAYSDSPDSVSGLLDYVILKYDTDPNTFAFFKFDWSSFPDSAIINNVSLRLNLYTTSGSTPVIDSMSFYYINETWSESSLNWNNRPLETAFGTNSNSFEAGRRDVILPDTTNIIENIKLYGFATTVIATTPNNFTTMPRLRSIQYSVSSEHPELVIDYSFPLINAPVLLNPADNQYVDIAKNLIIAWSTDFTQSQYELRYSTNESTWTTLSGTTAQQRTISSGTFAVGNLYFQIRYIPSGSSDWSDWSESTFVNAVNNPAAPTSITSGTITSARPTITATGTDVRSFTITLKTGGVIVETSTVTATSIFYVVQNPLLDATTYSIEITYKDVTGFNSDLGTSSITTAFVKPDTPVITVNAKKHYLEIEIDNPGSATVYNDIYKLVDNRFIRIATNVSPDLTYTDYFVKSDVEYQYYVRAYSAGGGYAQSTTVSNTVSFYDAILMTIDTSLAVELIYNPQRTETLQLESNTFKFAGRTASVVKYSNIRDNNITGMTFEMHDRDSVITARQIADYKSPVLYKDARGRLLFLAITSINIKDEQPDYYTVSFNTTSVAYDQEV